LEVADLDERFRTRATGGTLDLEAADVVHAFAAGVLGGAAPDELHAAGRRGRREGGRLAGPHQLGCHRRGAVAAGREQQPGREDGGESHARASRAARASWRRTSTGAVPPTTRRRATERPGVSPRTSAGSRRGAWRRRVASSRSRSAVPVARQWRTRLP